MTDMYRIALCQIMQTTDKNRSMERAARAIGEAARAGAGVVSLPEIWNAPYDVKILREFAEPAGGPSFIFMSELAKRHGIYLIGGSIPEEDQSKMYNTSFVFDPNGELIARHRKSRLFDVDIENGPRFMESDFFTAGEDVTLVDTEYGRIGISICFELRFPELFSEMNRAGAHIVFVPAVFNVTTGAAHWDTLIKSRALDNQMYVAVCGPARDVDASYVSWGHSCVATPWGEYCASTDAHETIVYADIDVDYVNKIRMQIPIGN